MTNENRIEPRLPEIISVPTDELLGTWVFNDNIVESTLIDKTVTLDFEFKSNNVNYTSMYVNLTGGAKNHIKYNETEVYRGGRGWTLSNNYKTIIITNTSNFSNDGDITLQEFLTWLSSNATKQETPPTQVSNKAISLENLKTFKQECDKTYAIKGESGNNGGVSITINQPSTATNGTLEASQLVTLQENDLNYIIFNNEIYSLNDKTHTADTLTYSHVGFENGKHLLKTISITVSTRAWVLNTTEVSSGCSSSSSIVPVDNLPTATEEEYNKHLLYLNGNDLNYIISEVADSPIISNMATMPSKRSYASSVAIGTNAYIFGGISGNETLTDILKYDSVANTCTKIGDMPSKRGYTSSVAIGTNAYIFGGSGSDYLTDILKYDSVANTCTKIGDMPSKRGYTSSVAIGTNAYIFGGKGSDYLIDILKYDSVANTCTKIGNMPSKRGFASSVAIGTNAYIFGGYGSDYLTDILKYDSVANTCTKIGDMPSKRGFASSVAIGTNAYIFGGYGSDYLTDILKYDSVANTCTKIGDMPSKRSYASSVAIGTNAYIFGGSGSDYLIDILKVAFGFTYKYNKLSRLDGETLKGTGSIAITKIGRYEIVDNKNNLYRIDVKSLTDSANSNEVFKFDTNFDESKVFQIQYQPSIKKLVLQEIKNGWDTSQVELVATLI